MSANKQHDYTFTDNPYDFIAVMASDMRRPVETIAGYAHLASMMENADSIVVIDGTPKITLKEFCEIVLRNRQQLNEFLDLMLEYVRRRKDIKS